MSDSKMTGPGWALLALGAVVLLACASPASDSLGKVSRTATTVNAKPATTPATPGPGDTQANPAPLGTDVSPALGWTVKVNVADLDATAIVRANRYNRRVETNKMVKVNVSVHNGSDLPGSVTAEMEIGVLGPSGVKTDPMWIVVGVNTIDLSAQLQPGGTITGDLVFEVPPAEIEGLVLLAEPRFTIDVNEDQRFLALR